MNLLTSAGSAPGLGVGLSAVTMLVLALSALAKLAVRSGDRTEAIQRFGYPPGALSRVALIEMVCLVVYAIPATSIMGAILITGYLGGAVATHVRVSDRRFLLPIVLGVCAWAGLYLRDARLALLLPIGN